MPPEIRIALEYSYKNITIDKIVSPLTEGKMAKYRRRSSYTDYLLAMSNSHRVNYRTKSLSFEKAEKIIKAF